MKNVHQVTDGPLPTQLCELDVQLARTRRFFGQAKYRGLSFNRWVVIASMGSSRSSPPTAQW
ncbi:MAG: hypothetical protein P8M80_15460 [Pirellulaceae bacterium]|nr:hypothetical protein [Pirellulaceae bacterium]